MKFIFTHNRITLRYYARSGTCSPTWTLNGTFVGKRYVIKRFLTENPGFLPRFRIFLDFFRPKPGQCHVDSRNLNFMKIC